MEVSTDQVVDQTQDRPNPRTIWNLDATEFLKQLPDNSAGLIITDPPYAAGELVSKHRPPGERFDEIPGNEVVNTTWMPEAFRVLKDDTAAYVFATWRNNVIWQDALEEAGFTVKNCIVWDKGIHGNGDLTAGFGFQHEFIIYAIKGRPSFRIGRPTDIKRVTRVNPLELRHPYQKPLQLYEWLMLLSSDKGDLVVDPFAGSGAVGKAAQRLKRRYMLNDIHEPYVAAMQEWLAEPFMTTMF